MHRDLKLGLALAVLLIGSTTAFFFRDDVDPDSGLPQLQNPVRIDDALGLGLESELGPPEEFHLTSDETPSDVRPTWARPAFLGGSSMTSLRRASVTPDPIQIILDDDVELLEPVTDSSAAAILLQKPSGDPDGERNYIVQPGDTLTGLAAKFLGSLTRYHEIYERNRDRLAGPDDLRVGMTLRIPPANAVTPTAGFSTSFPESPDHSPSLATIDETTPQPEKSKTEPSKTEPSKAESSDDAGERKLFVPAKKAPFVPRRFRSRSHAEPEVDSPGT